MKSRNLSIGIGILSFFIAIGLLSFFWLPYGIDDMSGSRLSSPSADHLFGTDKLGRDLLSRMMIGTQIALTVGFSTVVIGGTIGVFLGTLAGYAQRWLEESIASFLDVLIAFPTLLLAMLIVASRGASLSSAILAISLGASAVVSRLTRLLVKRVLAQEFILASRASGTNWIRIAFMHILPNIWPTLIVNLALQFGYAGLAEASLSFLGLGAPPPNSSWGSILQEAQDSVATAPIAAIAPGALLIFLVIGVNLIADGLRDRFDPTARGRR